MTFGGRMPKIIRDEDVFRAVMQVIIARGYDGATTRQLAAAAGVSEVTLFRKYGSKAQLVQLALRDIADRLQFEEVIRYTGDVFADLLHIVARYTRLTEQYGEFLAVLIPEIRRHPELVEALERPMNVMQHIGRLLLRYQEEGVLEPEPPLQAVAALLGPLVYFAMVRGTIHAGQVPPIDLEQHVSRFLDGRRVRG
ncbi:MAG: TetR/AcrR family transcriptional regulator [Caldilineae bacterium]|nr:MAG: TetR/AcrR family transcriptional regulator [Caldilineae bacterium]